MIFKERGKNQAYKLVYEILHLGFYISVAKKNKTKNNRGTGIKDGFQQGTWK